MDPQTKAHIAFWLGIVGALGAIGTLIQAVYNQRQWKEARKSNETDARALAESRMQSAAALVKAEEANQIAEKALAENKAANAISKQALALEKARQQPVVDITVRYAQPPGQLVLTISNRNNYNVAVLAMGLRTDFQNPKLALVLPGLVLSHELPTTIVPGGAIELVVYGLKVVAFWKELDSLGGLGVVWLLFQGQGNYCERTLINTDTMLFATDIALQHERNKGTTTP